MEEEESEVLKALVKELEQVAQVVLEEVPLEAEVAVWEIYSAWVNLMYRSTVLIKRSRQSLSMSQAWKQQRLKFKNSLIS